MLPKTKQLELCDLALSKADSLVENQRRHIEDSIKIIKRYEDLSNKQEKVIEKLDKDDINYIWMLLGGFVLGTGTVLLVR
jgi:hypothetical protein